MILDRAPSGQDKRYKFYSQVKRRLVVIYVRREAL